MLQGKIQQEQRRAEWEARKAENNDAVDKDLPSDDPFMGHPWADEIYMCSDLEKASSKVTHPESRRTTLMGIASSRSRHLNVLFLLPGMCFDVFPHYSASSSTYRACGHTLLYLVFTHSC
jgi:hypothetical protein